MRSLFFLFLAGVVYSEQVPTSFESLLNEIYSQFDQVEKKKLLTGNFFSGYYDGYFLDFTYSDPKFIDKVIEELSVIKEWEDSDKPATYIKAIVANELKLRELNKMSVSRRAWLVRSVAYLKDVNFDKLGIDPDKETFCLVDVIEYLQEQSDSGLLPFKVKMKGRVDCSMPFIAHFKRGARSFYDIIEFSCFVRGYPSVYFSYPELVFVGAGVHNSNLGLGSGSDVKAGEKDSSEQPDKSIEELIEELLEPEKEP